MLAALTLLYTLFSDHTSVGTGYPDADQLEVVEETEDDTRGGGTGVGGGEGGEGAGGGGGGREEVEGRIKEEGGKEDGNPSGIEEEEEETAVRAAEKKYKEFERACGDLLDPGNAVGTRMDTHWACWVDGGCACRAAVSGTQPLHVHT